MVDGIHKPPFSFEERGGIGGGFRVRDAADNRVATCFSEGNAKMVTDALNAYHGELVEWTCGHTAGAMCATCWGHLSQRSTVFLEIIDALLDLTDDEAAETQRKRLTDTLHNPISVADTTPSKGPEAT